MFRYPSNYRQAVFRLVLVICFMPLAASAQTRQPRTPISPAKPQPSPTPQQQQQQALPVAAALMPKPLFNSSPPEDKQLVIEYIYKYTKTVYTPAVPVQPLVRTGATYGTPEEAFISQISAMLAGDYEWWLSGFSAESQKIRKERDVLIKRTPAEWKNVWTQALKGQRVLLLERVETGSYVVLLYSLRRLSDDKETFRSIMPFKREDNRWVATLELAEDQFFHYYTEGKDRITIPKSLR